MRVHVRSANTRECGGELSEKIRLCERSEVARVRIRVLRAATVVGEYWGSLALMASIVVCVPSVLLVADAASELPASLPLT